MDNVLYSAREGTVEYPGSGAGANAVPSYVVKYKDTVDGVSQRFGVPRETIIERNKLKEPYTLTPGTTLELPGARVMHSTETATTAATPSGAPGPVKRETLPPPSQSEAPRSAAPAAGPASGEPTPLSSPAKSAAALPPPPAGPTPHFQWPLRGKVLVPYGSSGGQMSDGIDIEAKAGTPVHAAEAGTVVYDGEIPRLGNLILIQHTAGYITAYANNDKLLVKKDDVVTKGQVIANAGSSGGASSPRLHFEIRRGANKTLDPLSMLPK